MCCTTFLKKIASAHKEMPQELATLKGSDKQETTQKIPRYLRNGIEQLRQDSQCLSIAFKMAKQNSLQIYVRARARGSDQGRHIQQDTYHNDATYGEMSGAMQNLIVLQNCQVAARFTHLFPVQQRFCM